MKITKKREQVERFLDYGGNELFSSLMYDNSDRAEALDKMSLLLCKAVMWGKLNRRIGAYRYLIGKANESGYIRSDRLDAFRITPPEKKRIIDNVCSATSSKAYFNRYGKNILIAGFVAAIIVVAVVVINSYVHSEEYLKKMKRAVERSVYVEVESAAYGHIKFLIKNQSTTDYVFSNMPIIVCTDENTSNADITAKHIAKLGNSFITPVDEYEEGKYIVTSGSEAEVVLEQEDYYDSFPSGSCKIVLMAYPVEKDKNGDGILLKGIQLEDEFSF